SVAIRLNYVTVHLVVEEGGCEKVYRRFHLRDVDVLAQPGAIAVVERGDDRGQDELRRHVVGICSLRTGRRSILPAAQVIEPGQCRAVIAICGQVAIGPSLPTHAGADEDEPGVDLSKSLV